MRSNNRPRTDIIRFRLVFLNVRSSLPTMPALNSISVSDSDLLLSDLMLKLLVLFIGAPGSPTHWELR